MLHYKDRPPKETVSKIKLILKRIGIKTTVSCREDFVKKCYSLRLTVAGLSQTIGTNGKGVTAELAQASVHGEFMERLQNRILFKEAFSHHLDKNLMQHSGFYFFPDEVYKNSREIIKQLPPVFIRKMFSVRGGNNLERYFQDTFKESLYCGSDRMISFPYYHVQNESIVYLPLDMTITTNGMCAGNSREEALVQGISEILERHVVKEVVFKEIVPPTVPKDFLRKWFPLQYKMIESIEKSKKFKVIIKDCSLEKNLPVIAAIVINTEANGYIVSFGAHPDLKIALERSLTESFQGRVKVGSWVNFSSKKNFLKKQKWTNLCRIFHNGAGEYPPAFFKGRFSYPFNREKIKTNMRREFPYNHSCLEYLLGLINELNWDIFIRDVSFLGFPAYHIISPDASFRCYKNKNCQKGGRQLLRVASLARNLEKCSKGELAEIIRFTERYKGVKLSSFQPFLLTNRNKTIEYLDNIFLSLVYYRAGNAKGAYSYLKKQAPHFKNNEKTYQFYQCVTGFLNMSASNLSLKKIINSLFKHYPSKEASSVLKIFLSPRNVFSAYMHLPCPGCSTCELKKFCDFPDIKKIHLSINKLIKGVSINQQDLKQLSCHINKKFN